MKKSKTVAPMSTVSAPSRHMARNPEVLVDLEAVVAPPAEEVLRNYEAQGRRDVRVASSHDPARRQPPLDRPGKMQAALRRLAAEASPEECPVAAYAKEAYEAYLSGFRVGMNAYYPSCRYTVPSWDYEEKPLISFSDLLRSRRTPTPAASARTSSTPATV